MTMDPVAHYRFHHLHDAFTAAQWLLIEAGASQPKVRRRIELHLPERGEPVLRLGEASPKEHDSLQRLGRLVQDASIEGLEWKRLDAALDAVKLRAASIDPGMTLLALPKTGEGLERALMSLADLGVPNQRIVTFFESSNRREGIEFECPPYKLDARSLGLQDAELFVDVGGDRTHFVPAGWTHPILHSFPGLMPTPDSGDTQLWQGNHRELRTGAFRPMTREEEWRRPVEVLDLEVLKDEPTPLGSATLGSVPLRVEPRRIGEREDRTGLQAIVEIKDENAGTTEARLLDLLDDLEVGKYTGETTVWVARSGRSRASRARYFIRAGALPGPEVPFVPGVRVFVQPRSLRDRDIPLFLESGCVLRPNLDVLLPSLEDDHPVLQELRQLFPNPGEGESREVHLLRLGDRADGSPRFVESLENGQRLEQLLKPLRARPLGRLGEEISNDLEAALGQRVEETFGALERLADERMQELESEFETIHEGLQEELDAFEPQLVQAHDRHESARELFHSVPGLLESLPHDWDKIRDRVLELEANIVEQRIAWIDAIRREADTNQQALVARGQELADARHQAGEAIQGLEADHEDVESGFRELEALLPKAEAVQVRVRELEERLRRRSNLLLQELRKTSTLLASVRERQAARHAEIDEDLGGVELAEQEVAAEEARLRASEAELVARRKELEERRERIRERNEELPRKRQELESQEHELDKELDKLEALESRVLPALRDEIEHIRHEIAAKDGEGLMDEVQQWIHELNDHLEHLEARWGSRTQQGEEAVSTSNKGPRTTSRTREESRGSQPGWFNRFFGRGR